MKILYFHYDIVRNTANDGAPGRIRTHDPLVRSQVLYPTELRALNIIISFRFFNQRGRLYQIAAITEFEVIFFTLHQANLIRIHG